jgi:protein TonB
MVATSVGVVIRSALGPPAFLPETVEVDVGPVPESPTEIPAPASMIPASPVKSSVLRRAHGSPRANQPVSATSANDVLAGPLVPALPSPRADETPARFVLSAGTVATQSPGSSGTAAGESASGTDPAGDAIGEGDASVPARLLSSSPLVYPPAARQAEIETDFPVEIVVDSEGRVIAARAITRAGYGLDEAALRAIRAYRFSPALRDGRPVRVRMRWTVQFRLR